MTKGNSQIKRLQEKVLATPVVDPHTHLNVKHPAAKNLVDILFYHHVGSELISSGMPPDKIWKSELPQEGIDPGIPPEKRVANSLPYLKNIRNTTLGWFMRTILEDLYGVKDGQVTEKNWETVYQRVAKKAVEPNWADYLLQKQCHILRSISVENVFSMEPNRQFKLVSECPDLFMRCVKADTPKKVLESLPIVLNGEFTDGRTYRKLLQTYFARVFSRRVKAIGMWLPQQLRYEEVSDNEITTVITQIKQGEDSLELRNKFACYSIKNILDIVREGPIDLVQIFLGADVRLPHRSITVYSGILMRELCLFIDKYPDLRFDLLSASEHYIHDSAIVAKHFPNVYVAGYWWHTLYPYYIRKAIQTRLEIVPLNKITGFFSDAYHAEWCYPKLKMVKKILAEVLSEKVSEGYYSESLAVAIARKMLYDNPKNLYGL